MEALFCQECSNKEQKGAKARYKFITTGSEIFKYPLCRRCYNKLKRETRINPNEQPLVTPTSVNSSVSDDSLPASAAVTRTSASRAAATLSDVFKNLAPVADDTHASLTAALLTSPTAPRTRASAAAVIHAAIATIGVDKTDDSHSSLNRLQSSRNNFARDPLSQPLTPLSLGGASSFTTRSLHVHTREATPIGAANFKAIAYLSTGMDEVKDDCVELDGDVLKYLFPTHPKIKSHTENETPLVLFKCKGCGESFVKLKNDNSRFCQSFSCSNKRKRKMGSISKDNIPQTTDTVVSSILSILSAATSKKDDAAVIRIARQLYLISPESLAEYEFDYYQVCKQIINGEEISDSCEVMFIGGTKKDVCTNCKKQNKNIHQRVTRRAQLTPNKSRTKEEAMTDDSSHSNIRFLNDEQLITSFKESRRMMRWQRKIELLKNSMTIGEEHL